MMKDLISRKALLEAMQAKYKRLEEMKQNTPDYADAFTIIDILANELPTIEAASVVHGEWERIPYSYSNGYRCSCCGQKSIEKHWNFCPNCGARMDGKKVE